MPDRYDNDAVFILADLQLIVKAAEKAKDVTVRSSVFVTGCCCEDIYVKPRGSLDVSIMYVVDL